jgi:hypothetical protein
VSLLAALAATLIRPDVSENRCVSCGALVTSHFNGRLRWTGCADEQPQPEPRELVRLPKLLHFPTRGLDVHAGSVAQLNRDAARCALHLGENA